MKDKTKTMGVWGATALLVTSISARIFLNFPRLSVESAGTAAWIQLAYVSIIVLILFSIIAMLYKNFEGKDIIDIADYAGGTAGRLLFGIPILMILIYIGPVIMREYSENMKSISLQRSPISFIMFFFLIGTIIAAYVGIEAITRFQSIVTPIVIIAYLAILLGTMKYYDTSNLFPILGTGPKHIFWYGLVNVSVYGPIIYLFFLPPFLKKHKYFKHAGYISISICMVLFILGAVVYISVYPYHTGIEIFLPTFELARLIYYGRFLQRLESIFMLSWAAAGLMYLSTIFYFSLYALKKIFKLEYYKPLILPLGIIYFALSIIPQNLPTVIELEGKYYALTAWFATMFVPLITLVIANIKRSYSKGGKDK
jgi:spore germination protein (amino acid permease)